MIAYRTLKSTVVAMIVGIALAHATGCQSSNRATSETQSGRNGSAETREGDAIVGGDADRASAELDAQAEERRARGRRPSSNDSRGGTRSVDQPRVGGRP